MAEPVKKDNALAQAVREAFHRHMENARATAASDREIIGSAKPSPRLIPAAPANDAAQIKSPPSPSAAKRFRDSGESRGMQRSSSLPKAKVAPLDAMPNLDDKASSRERLHSSAQAPKSRAQLLENFEAELFVEEQAPPAHPEVRPPSRLAPPSPANDRADRGQRRPAREEDRPSRQKNDPRSSEQVPRPRRSRREEATEDDSQRGDAFEDHESSRRRRPSSRSETKKSSARLVVGVAAGLSAICLGVGVYLWMRSPASSPAQVSAVNAQPVMPSAGVADPVHSPLVRPVRTSQINLDEIDVAVHESRERIGAGDIGGARAALLPYRGGNDARVLVALAETYDPVIIKTPQFANVREAKALYEAAGRAGFKGAEARISRLLIGTAAQPAN